jgi:predicted permease
MLDLPRLAEVHLNPAVLGFALLLTLGSCVLFGVTPALRFLHTDPQAALQQNSGRTAGSRRSRFIRTSLIGLQVFGCTVLLLLTGLFSKSLLHLLNSDKGFDTTHTVVAELRLTSKLYPKGDARVAFDDGVLAGLRSLPGIQSAGLVSAMPLEGESWIEGMQRLDRPNLELPLFNFRWVSPGYFETMRERLVAGRFFEERDRNLSSAILSESQAKAGWPQEDPIGAQIQIEGRKFTVIGVVADSHVTSLKSAPARMVYVHYKDRPPYTTYFLARSARPVDELVAGVRQAVWRYAPDITIARIKTLDSQLTDSLVAERFQTAVLMSFGAAALLLAMLGIYAVLSYSVAGRRQEIGVRVAIGATRARIYSLTLGEAAIPVFTGLVAGVAASMVVARAVQNLLYGVETVDASVTVIVTTLFLAAALAAAFIPARRAASLDPMTVLRAD